MTLRVKTIILMVYIFSPENDRLFTYITIKRKALVSPISLDDFLNGFVDVVKNLMVNKKRLIVIKLSAKCFKGVVIIR